MARKNKTTPVEPTQAISELTDLYEVGEWARSPHYRCKLCTFDTLAGRDTMLTHLVDRHSSEAALEILFPKPAANESPASETTATAVIKETEDGTNEPN